MVMIAMRKCPFEVDPFAWPEIVMRMCPDQNAYIEKFAIRFGPDQNAW